VEILEDDSIHTSFNCVFIRQEALDEHARLKERNGCLQTRLVKLFIANHHVTEQTTTDQARLTDAYERHIGNK